MYRQGRDRGYRGESDDAVQHEQGEQVCEFLCSTGYYVQR